VKIAPSMNAQPVRAASLRATLVLPDSRTPMTTIAEGSSVAFFASRFNRREGGGQSP